ncbi:3-methyl-2-oxobutanoate hydroxymethyltransferase [Botrimarina colliarenosi]|uniref:3-methyl-2-oxobutanoate hydroxymethyltransferase n=1 Tax=Botrimarina colliarenosi TaxID=2528001 RepID=A0A5C6AK00_9BACT|nr:3-methyl-2-oxobutanoate hydroxymethyltransferase [Botrimarina colliarenosi]TWT99351.1 3-methyl-2-oxobutanoate hydroxymethyltransferase [Botrimarina colliarenosi]
MPQLTAPQFTARKGAAEKLVVLTAYDYTMARLVDAAGVDCVLVGDSLGMVVQGKGSTLAVTLDQMIYHAEMVGRAVENALTVVDLPFPINHYDTGAAIDAAARILKETRCQSVKLEGGEAQADTIHALVTAGIPVMAHVGLRPQSVHQLGGYKVQRDQDALLADARAASEAGAYGMVIECVPSAIAKAITDTVPIPTIGIGAGPDCDGQVLVVNDVLGMTAGYVPRFVKAYAHVGEAIQEAATAFTADVRSGKFPGPEQAFK